MKQVKFKEDTWLIKRKIYGFDGWTTHSVTKIKKGIWTSVDAITDYGDFSDVVVKSDSIRGVQNGNDEFLLNVPNSLFQVREAETF